LKSRPKHIFKPAGNSNFYICLLGGIGSFIGSYFLITNNLEKQFPQLPGILSGIFLMLFGLYCLYYCFNRKAVYVFEDFILSKSNLFKREVTIPFTDIQSWAELHKKSKYRGWSELYIFTPSKKYCFTSYDYGDEYETLKSVITKNKSRNLDYEKKSDLKSITYLCFFFLFLGVIFWAFGVSNYIRSNNTVPILQLVTLDQKVTSKIKIKKSGKSSRYISLRLNDNPEFSFNIEGAAYRATDTDGFVAEINTGDTLTVSILREDFEKKITKTKPLTFWDKSFGYYSIPVYGLAYKNRIYLSPKEYQSARKSGLRSNSKSLGIFGLILAEIGIFIYIQRKKIAAA